MLAANIILEGNGAYKNIAVRYMSIGLNSIDTGSHNPPEKQVVDPPCLKSLALC